MKPNKEIINLLDEIKAKQDELIDFEKELQNKRTKLDSLTKAQSEKFDFNRVNEIKELSLTIDNADYALRQQTAAFQDFKKQRENALYNLVNNDKMTNIYRDPKLMEQKRAVLQSVKDMKETYSEYKKMLNALWREYNEMYTNSHLLQGGTIHGYRTPSYSIGEIALNTLLTDAERIKV